MAAPFDINQSFHEAVTLQRQGRLRDAEKIFTRVLKAAPDHFDALNLLGTVKAQLGRMGEAHRLFSPPRSRSIRARPAPGPISVRCCTRSSATTKRSTCLDKARALDRDDLAILNQHANALLSLGRAEEALAEFRRASGARAAACRGAAQLRHRPCGARPSPASRRRIRCGAGGDARSSGRAL